MGITYDTANRVFHMKAKETSYILHILNEGYLAHLYWGKRINSVNVSNMLVLRGRSSFSPKPEPANKDLSLDTMPQEYPGYGNSDMRSPAFQVQLPNGSTVSVLKYKSHQISKGKPVLEGLPATYAEGEEEAETLALELQDELIGLRVVLYYSVYENLNVITRSVKFTNKGNENVKLLRALSMSLDFADDEFDFIHLHGEWARERHLERRPLFTGMQSVESRRGGSSHQHNPFIALARKNADEDQGDVYGFSLVYSGNFVAQAEVSQFKTARVAMGINPFDFTWLLEKGQSFQTPEAVMVYSSEGLGGMSRTYHKLYRTRLCRGQYRDQVRPILVNNWEATYFDFNSEKLLEIASVGKEIGIDLFVLDDGWFGKRNNDKSSLGDWFVNEEKITEGLNGLVQKVNDLGLSFGLWFEPEMVSPESNLYRAHPDWCLHVPDRSRTLGRNQLVLDFSREDVCDAITKMISDILSGAPITYVKWDMNRSMTEIGSALLPPERQRETAHRYILGLYRVMETITSRFPQILFESCSGGGGRFDPGMLYYMPQTWTSDDTDAVERLKIQYGTSLVYPASSMGAHVSAVPNHQVGRITSLEMRGNVAMAGNLGYELDLTKLSEEDKDIVRKQTEFYRDIRDLVFFGEFYRLKSPFEGNETAWNFVSEDQTEVYAAYFEVLSQPAAPIRRIKLKGLNPQMRYRLLGTEEVFNGAELMYAGLAIPRLKGDYQSLVCILKATAE